MNTNPTNFNANSTRVYLPNMHVAMMKLSFDYSVTQVNITQNVTKEFVENEISVF